MSVIRHVVMRGRVQGVGYRAFVEHEALRLGLEGWVRNRRDGTVEAVLSGADDVIAAMIDACRRGPPAARVEAVDAEEGDMKLLEQRRPGERFSVLRTA
jgi:acylphosphatase